jgi:hypothetical protein
MAYQIMGNNPYSSTGSAFQQEAIKPGQVAPPTGTTKPGQQESGIPPQTSLPPPQPSGMASRVYDSMLMNGGEMPTDIRQRLDARANEWQQTRDMAGRMGMGGINDRVAGTDTSLNMMRQGYNQARAQGEQGSFEDWARRNFNVNLGRTPQGVGGQAARVNYDPSLQPQPVAGGMPPVPKSFGAGGFEGGATVAPPAQGQGQVYTQTSFGGGTFEGGNGATVNIPPPNSPPPPSSQTSSQNYNQRTTPPPPSPFAIDSSVVPGLSGNADSYDDYNNLVQSYLNMFGGRDALEFGGIEGIGGNSVNRDGSWNAPDWMRNSANRYGEANTDAVTRGVTDGELVERRLAGLMSEDNELNRIAKEDALAQAARSGMLGSGVAAGAALRASRAAMMPIAQQDAQTVSGVESANMDARNRDLLADQQNRTGLLSQEIGTSANLLDSATDRRFRADEANTERTHELMRDDLGFRRDVLNREDSQQFQWASQEDQQAHQAWQGDLDRDLQRSLRQIDQEFQGNEGERNRQQQRVMAFYESAFGREGAMSSILASIYNNPNLTPQQQQSAAQNAQTIMRNLWNSFNTTLGAGVPDIFLDPYEIAPPDEEEVEGGG